MNNMTKHYHTFLFIDKYEVYEKLRFVILKARNND